MRDGDRALLLDAGSGLPRAQLDGVRELHIVLTHFHLDHVCGLMAVPSLPVVPTIWAPGRLAYGRASEELLAPLRSSPLVPFAPEEIGRVKELVAHQIIGGFEVAVRVQERHHDPTVGLRIGDFLALITDTAYDPGSGPFARGVTHLLHEAWSLDDDPSAADAARVFREAGAGTLTLIHLDPRLGDPSALLAAAQPAQLGRDGLVLTAAD